MGVEEESRMRTPRNLAWETACIPNETWDSRGRDAVGLRVGIMSFSRKFSICRVLIYICRYIQM